MITHEFLQAEGVAILRSEGILSTNDFEVLSLEIDPFIESYGNLQGLMIEAKEFHGWDSKESLLSQLKFIHDHRGAIRRIAVASDNHFGPISTQLANYFSGAEVRHFSYAQRDAARKWICEE